MSAKCHAKTFFANGDDAIFFNTNQAQTSTVSKALNTVLKTFTCETKIVERCSNCPYVFAKTKGFFRFVSEITEK